MVYSVRVRQRGYRLVMPTLWPAGRAAPLDPLAGGGCSRDLLMRSDDPIAECMGGSAPGGRTVVTGVVAPGVTGVAFRGADGTVHRAILGGDMFLFVFPRGARPEGGTLEVTRGGRTEAVPLRADSMLTANMFTYMAPRTPRSGGVPARTAP